MEWVKKIEEIGKNVVTGLVGVYAALNLGDRFSDTKDESKLVITTLITILVVRIVKELKTVKLFFFSIQKFISTIT